MDMEELKYWLALREIEGLGNIGCKALLSVLGSAREVFYASSQTLTAVPGIGPKIVDAIVKFDRWERIDGQMNTAARLGAAIITCRDALYPANLLQIHDHPLLLYVLGMLAPADVNVAVVGSRMASTYGKYTTEKLCRELALKGVTVVSGLARGIDAAAHRGALAGKGRTIAILGCGLDVIYPPENETLMHNISAAGAVVTEFPFGTPPHGPNFPARNRIISGMSLGVVVVEATDKSGSLITARLALEQNREVFAVPGSIDSPGSKGTNKLIKDGAKLVEHVDDILDEIMPQLGRDVPWSTHRHHDSTTDEGALVVSQRPEHAADAVSLTAAESAVLGTITADPVHIDVIIGKTKLKSHEALSILLNLELQGRITQLPGNRYKRRSNHA